MIIITALGKEYEASWCGVSPYDSALRFYLKTTDIADVFSTFTNPENTETITFVQDDMGNEKTYENYTVFKGVNVSEEGIAVSLRRP